MAGVTGDEAVGRIQGTRSGRYLMRRSATPAKSNDHLPASVGHPGGSPTIIKPWKVTSETKNRAHRNVPIEPTSPGGSIRHPDGVCSTPIWFGLRQTTAMTSGAVFVYGLSAGMVFAWALTAQSPDTEGVAAGSPSVALSRWRWPFCFIGSRWCGRETVDGAKPTIWRKFTCQAISLRRRTLSRDSSAN